MRTLHEGAKAPCTCALTGGSTRGLIGLYSMEYSGTCKVFIRASNAPGLQVEEVSRSAVRLGRWRAAVLIRLQSVHPRLQRAPSVQPAYGSAAAVRMAGAQPNTRPRTPHGRAVAARTRADTMASREA